VGKLILVRHGHTPLNNRGSQERLRGWLDVPLDQQGLQEAVESAGKLASYPVRAVFSSDLKRARQTAETICKATGADMVATNELRPWNLGVFCGQLLGEIIPFLDFLNKHPDTPAPNGESFHQFYERYSRRLHAVLKVAEESEGYVVAVTHVRNLLAAKTILNDGDRDCVPVKGGPSTGTLTFVENVNGAWRMRTDQSQTLTMIGTQQENEPGHVFIAS